MRSSEVYEEEMLVQNPDKKVCRFCLNINSIDNYKKRDWDQVLFETDNFVVFPSLGMLVEGWLLIATKDHFISMASMPDNLKLELLNLVQQVRKWLSDCYHQPTIFEHGPAQEGLSIGCGVDHAHIHLVPLKFNLITSVCKSKEFVGCTWQDAKSFYENVEDLSHQQQSYIYISEPSGMSVFGNPDDIPCQSIRRVISRELGIESKYDYNKYYFKDNIDRTKLVISNYLANLRS